MSEIIETWYIHNRINLYLLDAIEEIYLNDISASKGRKVADQFAHLHNVRMMWLKVAAPELLDGLTKFDKDIQINKSILVSELSKSADAVGQLLEKSFNEGKIKGFKPHPTAFLGYLISHESHHRGQIMLTLKQSGHALNPKTQYGLWEWGVR